MSVIQRQTEKNEAYIAASCMDIKAMKALLSEDFKGYEILTDSLQIVQGKTNRLNFTIKNDAKNEVKLSLMSSSVRVDGKLKVFVNKKSYDNAALKFNEAQQMVSNTTRDLQDTDIEDVIAQLS